MSTISEAFKKNKKIIFLVELDFEGWKQRFTTYQGGASIPYSGYDDRFFDGIISEISEVRQSMDLVNLRYSMVNISCKIINRDRFQDNEIHHNFNAGTGKVYAWTDGLDWSDIEDYPLFSGVFRKSRHDKYFYEFELIDPTTEGIKTLPENNINDNTWSAHRTIGGGGSVAGKFYPLVFGDWTKAVPLYCIDTANFIYLVCSDLPISVDADYTAATVNVYDKDASTIAAANYTFYNGLIDGLGNIVSYFDFTGDQVSNEPLTCSIEGYPDNSGIYTGSTGTLIENPADIIYYLLDVYGYDLDIDVTSIKTVRSILSNLRCASIINSQTTLLDIVDRLLIQAIAARVNRWGKMGFMAFDFTTPEVSRIQNFDFYGKTAGISATPYDMICNRLKVFYALNPSTGAWEGELNLDRTNNKTCLDSYRAYGEKVQKVIFLSDVRTESLANYCADRYLNLYAFQRDIVEINTPYWQGWDTVEGDRGLLTIEEGADRDGGGWTNEPFILIEKIFYSQYIGQKWIRVNY